MPRNLTRLSSILLLIAGCIHSFGAETPVRIQYPLAGSVFPPEFPSPAFIFDDPNPQSGSWRVEVTFSNGAPALSLDTAGDRLRIGEIDPRCVAPSNQPPSLSKDHETARVWRPDPAVWETIKRESVAGSATITIIGQSASGQLRTLSRGQTVIRTSKHRVGAPIFYRDVPLMPAETEKGVIKPLAAAAVPLIAWRLRDIGETKSRVVMEGIHSCANCHSASLDGKTLGMDLDGPQNHKGLYALFSIQARSTIRQEDVITWSNQTGTQGEKLRVGFMSQVSPDGRHVVTMIPDGGEDQTDYQRRRQPRDLIRNYYVANFKDYRFLQVFYPTRGILAWYDRESGKLQPLPGADDRRYVHTNAVWTPDGKHLIFARALARDAYGPGSRQAEFANDPNETSIQYDLYRIPFNDGKGGTPEPIEGASANGMSNSFPKVSPDGRWIAFVQAKNGQLMRPDSQLYLVPVSGGTARRMTCNTPLMNSWHSFSPNSRWMVFSSKSRSPYTQMFLTHIDEEGNDSPAILIENATAANRAVNIPEFLNIQSTDLERIDAPVVELYRVIDIATELAKQGNHSAAIAEWRKAIALGGNEASVHFNLANALAKAGSANEAIEHYEKAIALSPDHAEAHNNLGNVLVSRKQIAEAIRHFEIALESNPANTNAHSNLGTALVQNGRLAEAIPHFEIAARADGEQPDVLTNYGITLALTGRPAEAVPILEKAAALRPDSVEAQFLVGRVLVTDGRFAEAIAPFERAVALTGGQDPRLLDLVAGCYARAGRTSDAITTTRKAIQLSEANGNREFAQALRIRLAEYESMKSAQ